MGSSPLFSLTMIFPSLVCSTVFLLGFAVSLFLIDGAAERTTIGLSMETALTNMKV